MLYKAKLGPCFCPPFFLTGLLRCKGFETYIFDCSFGKGCAGEKTITTYAYLDQGSTASLCKLSLLNCLGIWREQTNHFLTTVNGHPQKKIDVKKATLYVSALNSNCKVKKCILCETTTDFA